MSWRMGGELVNHGVQEARQKHLEVKVEMRSQVGWRSTEKYGDDVRAQQ